MSRRSRWLIVCSERSKVGASIGCRGRQTDDASEELADATGRVLPLLYPCVEWIVTA